MKKCEHNFEQIIWVGENTRHKCAKCGLVVFNAPKKSARAALNTCASSLGNGENRRARGEIKGKIDRAIGLDLELSEKTIKQLAEIELVGQMVPLEDMRKLREWMREPDYAEQCDLAWLLDWVNRRPLSVLLGSITQAKEPE